MEGGIASSRNVVMLTAIIQLVTASREQLKILDYLKNTYSLGTRHTRNQLRKYHLSTDIVSIWNQQTSYDSLSPQCDGMVEHMNRSLLQMLRTYVEQDYEWEWYLPLVLYAYHTAVHTSTGVSLFVLMIGTECRSNDLSPPAAFDTNLCQGYLQAKLTELQDCVVKANTVQAGAAQKTAFKE